MSYVTAVTNRTITDYQNLSDWERMYGNAKLVIALVEILEDTTIAYTSVSEAVSETTLPKIDDYNGILTGIENLRQVAVSNIPSLTTEIKDDWVAGIGKPAPSYVDANLWESTLDTIWTYYNGSSYDVCPTLTSNLTITTGNYEVYIDCIDCDIYDIELQGNAQLFII